MVTWADLQAEYAAPKQNQPALPPAQGQSQPPAPMTFDSLKSKYQNYTPPSAAPVLPAQPQKIGQGAAGEFAGNVLRTVAEPLQRTGAAIETGLDKIFGTNTGSKVNAAVDQETKQHSTSVAGKTGDVVGTVLPYLTGAGEEEGTALGARALAKTGSKIGSWLAEHLPTFAANTAIGTAQTGDIKSGAESAVGAEVGQSVLGTAGKYISNAGKRAESALADAFAPKLGPKGYEKVASTGAAKIAPPSIFGKAGAVSDSMKSVQNATSAIKEVAGVLGKKVKDIISTGSGSVTKNFNRVTDTIGEYAENHVKPFLAKSGVDYNFSDLKDALNIVKPPTDLKGEALDTYNNVRSEILNAVSSKVSPSVTGGKNLTALRGMATDAGKVPKKVTGGDPDFWDARKIIDDIGNTVTKGKIFNSPEHTGATRAWQDFRAAYKNYLSDAFRYAGQMDKVNKANDFLSTSQMGKMDKTGWDIGKFEKQFGLDSTKISEDMQNQWDKYMKNLEGLYQGRSNIASQLNSEKGKSLLGIWAKEYPRIVKGLGAAGVGAAGALGAGGVYEAGTAIFAPSKGE